MKSPLSESFILPYFRLPFIRADHGGRVFASYLSICGDDGIEHTAMAKRAVHPANDLDIQKEISCSILLSSPEMCAEQICNSAYLTGIVSELAYHPAALYRKLLGSFEKGVWLWGSRTCTVNLPRIQTKI